MTTPLVTTQTYLQRLSLRLSHDRGDEVDDYTADGVTDLAIDRQTAINRAVDQIYDVEFSKLLAESNSDQQKAAEKMMSKYDIFNSVTPITIISGTPDMRAYTKPESMRRIKSILVNASIPSISNKEALPLSPDQFVRVMSNPYSNYKPTADNPRFYEYTDDTLLNKVNLLIDTIGTQVLYGSVKIIALRKHTYQEFNLTGPDIIAPFEWEDEIINRAKILLTTGKQ